MQQDELQAIQGKFQQGLGKLELLSGCLASFAKGTKLAIRPDRIDEERGELAFRFAGMRYYVRIRITDRDVDDVGTEYKVPVGWLDWGRYVNEASEAPIESNYFDERGILCEIEKESFYCDFKDCDDDRVRRGMLLKIGRLVGRTIAHNNVM